MPGGVTKEMGKATPEEVGFYPASGFARFAFSGNVAGWPLAPPLPLGLP
jgi:hypothetical protein